MKIDMKIENAKVLEIARHFMEAVLHRKDWQPFAQLRARDMKVAPNIPAFTAYRIVKTRPPENDKYDPEQCREVMMEITLGTHSNIPPQTVSAIMMAVREVNWETCPECDKGITEDESACIACLGTGRKEFAPARIPAKGTDSYESDVLRGVWGICPTSFAYIEGTQERIS